MNKAAQDVAVVMHTDLMVGRMYFLQLSPLALYGDNLVIPQYAVTSCPYLICPAIS